MRSTACSEHAGQLATHRCEGCGRMLCPICVVRGERIDRCRLCGELAVRPRLDDRTDAGAFAVRGWDERLLYPLRGRQGIFLGLFVALLVPPVIVETTVPATGCVLFLPRFLLALLLPAVMGDIARSTAMGEESLHEWPTYGWERLFELVGFSVAGILSSLPAASLLSWSGCLAYYQKRLAPRSTDFGALLAETTGSQTESLACLALTVLGLALGSLVWIPAYGTFAASGETKMAFDILGHARAIRDTLPEIAPLAGACGGGLALTVAGFELSPDPVVGEILQVVAGSYTAILGAHLAGFYARRCRSELDETYTAW